MEGARGEEVRRGKAEKGGEKGREGGGGCIRARKGTEEKKRKKY